MQFNKSEIMKCAIIGIEHEINERIETIQKGWAILKEREQGIYNRGRTKTTNEVREIIARNQDKLDELHILREKLNGTVKFNESVLVEYAIKGIEQEIKSLNNINCKEEGNLNGLRVGRKVPDINKRVTQICKSIKKNNEKIDEKYELKEHLGYAIQLGELELIEDLKESMVIK